MRIKRFLKKYKAIVIVLIAVIVALANYLLYPTFIKKDMQLIEVPITKQEMVPGTKISEDMLDVFLTNKDMIPENVILNKEEVVGNYTAANYSIPQKSFIYKEAITSEKQALGNIYYELSDGQVAYTIKIDTHQYKDKKFKAGQVIDTYFRCEVPQKSGKDYVVGKLQNSVKVISVSDADGVYITLAMSQKDLEYYLIAEKIGEVIPILDIEADGIESEEKVFSIDSTRQYLETKATVLIIPENTSVEEIEINEENTGALKEAKGSRNEK